MGWIPRERGALAPETFRPRIMLRSVVLMAGSLWAGVFFVLLTLRGISQTAYASAAFFVGLFTLCSLFYGRLAFTISEAGLTVRTLALERTVDFEDILRIDVVPGPLGVGVRYDVSTRAGLLQFSSLLAGHERLCALIIRKAGLT